MPTRDLMEGFAPLPHRCEHAGSVDGVVYVDDSKGTNVAASVTAMTSLEGRKVVILGGRGKGEDYAPLAEAVAREADTAVLLGEEREAIADALRKAGFSAIRMVENFFDFFLHRMRYIGYLSSRSTSFGMKFSSWFKDRTQEQIFSP